MNHGWKGSFYCVAALGVLLLALWLPPAMAQDTTTDPGNEKTAAKLLKQEIEMLKKREAEEQKRLQALERRLQQLEGELSKAHSETAKAAAKGEGVTVTRADAAASAAAPALLAGPAAAAGGGGTSASKPSASPPTVQSLQDQINSLKAQLNQVTQAQAGTSFGSMVSSYLGTHRFTLVGEAAADFIFDSGQGRIHATDNTFNLHFAPIILYQVTPWILFEGSISGHLGLTSTFYTLPVDDFQNLPEPLPRSCGGHIRYAIRRVL